MPMARSASAAETHKDEGGVEHGPRLRTPANEPVVDGGACDDAGGGDRKQAAEARLRHAKALDEQKRRHIDVGEEAREDEGVDDREAHAHLGRQRATVSGDDRRRPQVPAIADCVRLIEQKEGDERDGGANARQQHIDDAPGAERQDCGADRRRDQRRDAEDQRNRGNVHSGLMPVEQVADDRARQHPDRAGADPLEKPEGKQRADRERERAACGAKREDEDPGQHHRLSAEPVRERADDERRGRKAGEKDRDGGRGLRLGGAEIGLDEPEARQRHVDRQRRQRGQGGQKGREAESVNVEAH